MRNSKPVGLARRLQPSLDAAPGGLVERHRVEGERGEGHAHEHAEAEHRAGLRLGACGAPPQLLRERREVGEVALVFAPRDDEEQLQLAHAPPGEQVQAAPEVGVVEPLPEERPHRGADTLDPQGERVLVGLQLEVRQPGRAGEDVHPLAHRVHQREGPVEAFEQAVDLRVGVEGEAGHLEGGGAGRGLQRVRRGQEAGLAAGAEPAAVAALEAERAPRRAAPADLEARGAALRPGQQRHDAVALAFERVWGRDRASGGASQVAGRPEAFDRVRHRRQALRLRSAARVPAGGRERPDRGLALAEEQRVGHRVARLRHRRGRRRRVRPAEHDDRPVLVALARPHRHVRAGEQDGEVHQFGQAGGGHQHEVELFDRPVGLRAGQQGHAVAFQQGPVFRDGQEGEVDERAGEAPPQFARQHEVRARPVHVAEAREPHDEHAQVRLGPRGVRECGVGQVQQPVAEQVPVLAEEPFVPGHAVLL